MRAATFLFPLLSNFKELNLGQKETIDFAKDNKKGSKRIGDVIPSYKTPSNKKRTINKHVNKVRPRIVIYYII